jgi:hypothetical protein
MADAPVVRHEPAPGQDYVQNRWWSIPGGCLLLLTLFVVGSISILVLIQFSLSRSGAYRSALELARHSALATAELGSPIEPGWFTSGNVTFAGNIGDAQLVIPVAGPRNHGTLFVVAHKQGMPWQFNSLQLAVSGHSGRLDLLQNSTVPKTSEPAPSPSDPATLPSPPPGASQ